MKAIIAVNNLGFIGIGNEMLWKSKEDFQHFRSMTTQLSEHGNEIPVMLVGNTTAQGMPPLKGRKLIVVSKQSKTNKQFWSPENALNNSINNIDWIIGGKSIYEQTCHLWTELHISHINDNSIGDVVFPDLTKLNKNCKIFNYYFETIK